ncbi:hypothetical protein E8E11_010944 [Didymella keratinophila]|nr:hypothetical protein E8E11_010944 [Didymella keratinophila]
MARIMKQCGKERSSSTDPTIHQRRKLGKKATKRVDRVVQKLVLGRKALTFFIVTCIALLAIVLIASFAIKLDLYTACLMLGIWGIKRLLQRQTIPLWLDQICINQSSLHGKNHQTSRMASIYQNAESVIVWLFGVQLGPEKVDVYKNRGPDFYASVA